MNFFPFHIGDYIKSSSHLSDMEDLAYRRLLDMYYDTEAPLKNDLVFLSRRIKVSQEIISAVLADFFQLIDGAWSNHRCDTEIKKYHAQADKNRANGRLGGRPKKPSGFPVGSQSDSVGIAMGSQSDASGNPLESQPRTKNQEPNNPPTPQGGRESVFDEQEPSPERVASVTARMQAILDKRSAAAAAEVIPGFDAFWDVYPKKVAKGSAKRAWGKLKLTDELQQTIIAAVKEQAQSQQWTKDGGQFIPHPSTWLTQERWADASEDARRAAEEEAAYRRLFAGGI